MRPPPVRSRCGTRRARGTAINWQGDSSVPGLSAAGLREHVEADERIISSFFIVHGDDKASMASRAQSAVEEVGYETA